jgi:hypothetical protein
MSLLLTQHGTLEFFFSSLQWGLNYETLITSQGVPDEGNNPANKRL